MKIYPSCVIKYSKYLIKSDNEEDFLFSSNNIGNEKLLKILN